MTHRRVAVTFVSVLLILGGCTGPRTEVITEPSATADFRAFKTYAFIPAEHLEMAGSRMRDPVTRHRLEEAIARELQSKGLSSAPREEANLLVSYFADVYEGVDEKTPISPSTGGMNVRRQGRIVIDLIDAAGQQVVWHGEAWARDPKSQDAEYVLVDLLQRYPR